MSLFGWGSPGHEKWAGFGTVEGVPGGVSLRNIPLGMLGVLRGCHISCPWGYECNETPYTQVLVATLLVLMGFYSEYNITGSRVAFIRPIVLVPFLHFSFVSFRLYSPHCHWLLFTPQGLIIIFIITVIKSRPFSLFDHWFIWS
ncbi:hypothetical protein XENTR_v10015165 [Xenopus tropicalis]|nr:hypothetical protein XENTR_v10015165 [Xenopus tropicalis]